MLVSAKWNNNCFNIILQVSILLFKVFSKFLDFHWKDTDVSKIEGPDAQVFLRAPKRSSLNRVKDSWLITAVGEKKFNVSTANHFFFFFWWIFYLYFSWTIHQIIKETWIKKRPQTYEIYLIFVFVVLSWSWYNSDTC